MAHINSIIAEDIRYHLWGDFSCNLTIEEIKSNTSGLIELILDVVESELLSRNTVNVEQNIRDVLFPIVSKRIVNT